MLQVAFQPLRAGSALAILVLASFRAVGGPGDLDQSLDAGLGADDAIESVIVQPDGKILVGGYFTTFDGIARSGVVRLLSSGKIDTGFNPGEGTDSAVLAIALQGDGKILIGGLFTQVDRANRNGLARLNPDGSLDPTLKVGSGFTGGVSPAVASLAVQADGKILVGGDFSLVHDARRSGLVRLNTDGSTDTNFDARLPSDGPNRVQTIKLQPDQKILIAGTFEEVGGKPRRFIARLNGDGTLDTGFNSDFRGFGALLSIALQTDDERIVVAGSFTNVSGVARSNIARLLPNGDLDHDFAPGGGTDDQVDAVIIQNDGAIIIGGDFSTVNQLSASRLARLSKDGGLDAILPGVGRSDGDAPAVYALANQPDGNLLVAGYFTQVNDVLSGSIVRLIGVPPSTVSPFSLGAQPLLPGAPLQISFSGEVGRSYRLQKSADLISWLELTNFIASSTLTTLTDSNATNTSSQFYRAVTP